MIKKADTSTTFRIVGVTAAAILLLAAVLIWSQRGGEPPSAELAAVSQGIPGLARSAVAGEDSAFEGLETSVERLTDLHSEGNAPGNPSRWRSLISGAADIRASRDELLAVREARAQIAGHAASIVRQAEVLLDFSGAGALVQRFQLRADRLRQLAAGRTETTGTAAASAMNEELEFLRDVAAGLAGEASNQDVRPLNEEARESVLAPLQNDLAGIEEALERIGASIGTVDQLPGALEQLEQDAAALAGAFAGSTAESGLTQNRLLPLVLILLAVVLIGVMLFLNKRSALFERSAKEHADQNERNQQAILRLLDEMGSLADGDLTVEATVTEDITGTIADSFNYAIEELRKLVATVNETSIMVDSAAKQTESTATHMAKAAENQAREINAATESIVSMAASIEEVSGNAERSSDVARHSVEVAHKGGEAVRRTIDGMNTIRETIQDTSKRIKRLGESSQEIGNIVELINDIAEQTNILALNASIQASMAGEAGRGFAVVADEVQRLAERSTNATKQIEVLVRTIQSDTNEAVVSMERSTTDVVGGALLAENAGAALDEIEQVSNQIASLVQNISGSARQQAGSAADVTRRTTRLKEISEQTGKATTATAAAISKLSELASQLRKTVAGFTLPDKALHSSALSAPTVSDPVREDTGEQAKTG